MKNIFLLSIGYLIFAEFIFSTMGMVIKITSDFTNLEVIVFFRNFINLAFFLLWIPIYGIGIFATQRIKAHFIRSGAGLLAMYCLFYTISNTYLTQATLLFMTSPLFIPFIARFWLKHKISPMTWLAIIIGFIGVGFILQPEHFTIQITMLTGMSAAILSAIVKVSLYDLGKTERNTTIIFYFSLLGSIVSFFLMLPVWSIPNISTFMLLILIGILGIIGQFFLTKAFTLTSAGYLGAFTYTSVIFSTTYGVLIWSDPMNHWTLIGGMMIISAGVLALQYKQQKQEIMT